METKRLGRGDDALFNVLLALFADVFEESYVPLSPERIDALLSREDVIVLVALEKDNVIGGLIAYVLPQYKHVRSIVYVYDLGVMREQQRKGVGTLLIQAIQEEARRQNAEEIFVQAELADMHALEFYRKTGASEEPVVHFTYTLS